MPSYHDEKASYKLPTSIVLSVLYSSTKWNRAFGHNSNTITAGLEIFHFLNWHCVIYPLNWLCFFIGDRKAVDVFE